MKEQVGQRIVVIGSGGKTTLAAELARRLAVPHVELDALHWEPGWNEAELDTFRKRVKAALSEQAWVADGNYSKVREIVWPRADTIVWLDYPLRLVLRRLLMRTIRRVASKEPLWESGNRETIRNVFSKDSLFLWHLQTHRRRRRNYIGLLSGEWAHLRLIHHKSPKAAQAWLTTLKQAKSDQKTTGS